MDFLFFLSDLALATLVMYTVIQKAHSNRLLGQTTQGLSSGMLLLSRTAANCVNVLCGIVTNVVRAGHGITLFMAIP